MKNLTNPTIVILIIVFILAVIASAIIEDMTVIFY